MPSLHRFSVQPLYAMTRQLADVASGRRSPDLVIRGGRILSVLSETFIEGKEIWISGGRLASIVPCGTCSDSSVPVEDVGGGILAPGLVDPHIHVESSMMTVCAYAEAALLNGTTTIFCDSHEIGNVHDVEGIEWMLEDARQAPLNTFLTLPSTIPATDNSLETAGGDLDAAKAAALFDKWPEILALGEKMDFVPVFQGSPRSHAIIAEALRRNRPISGHCYGREFVQAYAASGITDTHEAIDSEIAADFLEAGLWVFLRGGPPTTPWHSLPSAIKMVTEKGYSPKRVCVCTDDRDADDLFDFGLDWVVTQAIHAGVRPATAWSMGSLHPATRFGVDQELGSLSPSRRADVVLLDDNLKVRNTWYGGELVVKDGKITSRLDQQLESQRYTYPRKAYTSVLLPKEIPSLIPSFPKTASKAHIIGIEQPGIVTLHKTFSWDPAATSKDEFLRQNNLCYLTVIERHGKNGNIGYGFLKGFGLTDGAVASSVGHDAHNIIIAGTSAGDMELALQAIQQSSGGIVVVQKGSVKALVPLPIAGLLSDCRAPEVAAQTEKFKKAWMEAGCQLPYMGFNLLPLSVIPEIRLTDKGLVKVPEMLIQPLFES